MVQHPTLLRDIDHLTCLQPSAKENTRLISSFHGKLTVHWQWPKIQWGSAMTTILDRLIAFGISGLSSTGNNYKYLTHNVKSFLLKLLSISIFSSLWNQETDSHYYSQNFSTSCSKPNPFTTKEIWDSKNHH